MCLHLVHSSSTLSHTDPGENYVNNLLFTFECFIALFISCFTLTAIDNIDCLAVPRSLVSPLDPGFPSPAPSLSPFSWIACLLLLPQVTNKANQTIVLRFIWSKCRCNHRLWMVSIKRGRVERLSLWNLSEARDVSLSLSLCLCLCLGHLQCNLCSKRSMCVYESIDPSIYPLIFTFWFYLFAYASSRAEVNNLSSELANLPENCDECLCVRWSVYLSVCLSVSLSFGLAVFWSSLRCLLASDPIKRHNCCCFCCCRRCPSFALSNNLSLVCPEANGTYIYLDARVLIGKWTTHYFF